MKTLLVATDFSYSSFNAARYALSFAQIFPACKVIIYHSCTPEPQFGDRLNPVKEDASLRLDGCRADLHDLEVSLLPYGSAQVTVESRTDIRPLAEGCLAIAAEEAADLLIIGSHSGSAWREWLFGSHTMEMIDLLQLPVLVVPPDCVFEPVGAAVLAYEPDHADKVPVPAITSVVNSLGSRLIAVNVVEDASSETSVPHGDHYPLRERLAHLEPQYHQLHHAIADDALIHFAEEQHAGMLIVLHRKHTFFYRLFHDSFSRNLAGSATLPVLVLKEKEDGFNWL